MQAGEHILRDRCVDLDAAVLGDDDRRLCRGGHAALHDVHRRDRARAGRSHRAVGCLLVDLVHARLDLGERRRLLRARLLYAGLRLRKALLGLGQILLSGRACLEQRLGVLDGELRLLDADLRVLDGLFGRGFGRIVRLAQRGHGRGDRRGVHVQQSLPLRDLVALADAERQHLTGEHREHLHLVVRNDLAVDRVFGAHRALCHLGHLNGGACCGLLLPVVARLAAAARAERHGCCEQRR